MGGGLYWKDWRLELVGDSTHYRTSLIFIAPTEIWDIRGSVKHGNRWKTGFKQTGLVSSVGYPLGDYLTLGGFYEIKNTTQRSVDDLYGGYLGINL